MLPLIFKNLKGTELDEWLYEPENIKDKDFYKE